MRAAMIAALIVAVLAGVTGSGDTITGSGSSPGVSVGGLPAGYVAVPVPYEMGAGTYCMHTVVVPVGTRFPPYNGVSSQTEVPCAGAVPSPAQLARAWAQSARLPPPALVIAPGYAVTGLTAYLQINTLATWATSFADPYRHTTITVTCGHTGFDVDWGDGSSLSTSSTGGPYPAGDVTHAYQDATPGTSVSVVEHWTCTWSGGVLTGLASTGTLPLEVRELQGVLGP